MANFQIFYHQLIRWPPAQSNNDAWALVCQGGGRQQAGHRALKESVSSSLADARVSGISSEGFFWEIASQI